MPDQASGVVRRIAVLSTGGTISAGRDGDGSLTPQVTVDRLLSALPVPPPPHCRVIARQIMSVDSAAMSLADSVAVARHVDEKITAGAGGVVVLHGTDTMEETALITDLLSAGAPGGHAVPVVFTGAQRGADHSAPDGPANLALAIETASGSHSTPPGVVIAFGGTILRAWGTRKVHTRGLDAFSPWPDFDAADRLRDRARGATRCGIDTPLPRVDVVALYPGADSTALDAHRDAGARGLVIEAMGAGNANADIVTAVRDAVGSGIPVVVTTRVPHGPAFADYGGGGGGTDLVAAGAMFSPVLRPGQARALLAVLLAAGRSTARIAEVFGN